MKKYIYKFMLIILLMIDPNHLTNSSGFKNETISHEDYLNFSKRIKIREIEVEIEKQYEGFYENLDTISSSKYSKKFIENLKCYALEAKSLPSISIAQAAIETGYGRHLKLKYNIFGIKGKGIRSKTKEFINGKYVVINSEFQYIKNLKHAFQRHFDIIDNYGVSGDNYLDWIDIIVSHGYATDPLYDVKLKYIIRRFQLDKLDEIQKLDLELKELN